MTATNIHATTDYRNHYGAVETNGLVNGAEYHGSVSRQMSLKDFDSANGQITRVRILTGQGIWDISYIYGTLPTGELIRLNTSEFNSMGLRKWEVKNELIQWAKRSGVYAKRIGLLDTAGVWSVSR